MYIGMQMLADTLPWLGGLRGEWSETLVVGSIAGCRPRSALHSPKEQFCGARRL